MSESHSTKNVHDLNEADTPHDTLLIRTVWSALEGVRASSCLTLDEYAKPVLDLLVLTEANRRAKAPVEKDGNPTWTIDCLATASFDHLLSVPEHLLGESLNKAFHAITESNSALEQVTFSDFNSPKLDKANLRPLLQALARTSSETDGATVSRLFESLLDRFAAASGQHSGAFSTPQDIRTLLISLIKPESGMCLYDPCAGTSGFLKEGLNYVRQSTNAGSIALFGQEINTETLSIGRMNLALSGAANANLAHGNTLTHPQHIADGGLMQFDRVVSNPPFAVSLRGMNLQHDPFNRFRYGLPPASSGDFAFIQHMLASLKPNGVMATIVSHGVLFRGGREEAIRKGIVEDDLVEAVIGLPPALFYGTGISSVVLILNRRKLPERQGKVLFVNADKGFQKGDRRNCLGEDDIARITTCFNKFAKSERFAAVATIDDIRTNDYNLNIQRYADSSALSGLVTQYDSFEKVVIKELALEVNSVRRGGEFTDKLNAVYIPMVGKRVTHRLDDIAQRHDRFYQVVLSERAINAYVAQFLGTSVGQHALSLMAVGSVIQRPGKADLNECIIALPDLITQLSILGTHDKLAALKNAIGELDRELSVNPVGLSELQAQLDAMLNVIGKLSDADKTRSLIREGESKTVEFKESFSLNLRHDTGQKDKVMEEMCLKTIVAFLNSEGGHLLVGVADDGRIAGLGPEIVKFHKDSTDKFLLHFKNTVEKRIGPEFYPFINYRLVDVDGKNPMVVECKQSQKPCFLDGEVFYVRTNPATDKLVGSKQLEYIRHRFG